MIIKNVCLTNIYWGCYSHKFKNTSHNRRLTAPAKYSIVADSLT